MSEDSKNKFQHNDDGTTFIFIESKSEYFLGMWTIIIDTEDWDRVKVYRWHLMCRKGWNTPYVKTFIPNPNKDINRRRRQIPVLLHHLILGKPQKGMVVDHINHKGLDNRKENLRFASRGQNGANAHSRKNSTSQYLGVGWDKIAQKWRTQIQYKKKVYYLGIFICEHQAALAYNKKAKELHGEFANLNVVPQEYVLKYEGKI